MTIASPRHGVMEHEAPGVDRPAPVDRVRAGRRVADDDGVGAHGAAGGRGVGGRASAAGGRGDDGGGRSKGRAVSGRRRRLSVGVVIAVVVAVVAGAIGAGVYALWFGQRNTPGEVIKAGDLSLTLDDSAITWTQTTPGVPVEQRAHGTLTSVTPPTFTAQPGDVIEIIAPVTTLLKGDNLQGELLVQFAPDQSQTATEAVASATYHIAATDPNTGDLVQVAPQTGDVPLGQTVLVDGLVGSDAGQTDAWAVVIQIEVGGDYIWVSDGAAPTGLTWSAGMLDVELRQVVPGSSIPAPAEGQ